MKTKLFPLITLLCGVVFATFGLVLPFFIMKYGASDAIIIIGGADTPTYARAIWQMNGLPMTLVMLGAALLLTGTFWLVFTKTVKNSCTLKTTLISIGLSLFGGTGIVTSFIWFTISVFHDGDIHPILYPSSTAAMALSFFAFVGLIIYYCYERWEKRSVKGFVIDVCTSIVYLPFFTLAASFGIEVLRIMK